MYKIDKCCKFAFVWFVLRAMQDAEVLLPAAGKMDSPLGMISASITSETFFILFFALKIARNLSLPKPVFVPLVKAVCNSYFNNTFPPSSPVLSSKPLL